MVETFDFTPPDAEGWLGCIQGAYNCVATIKHTYLIAGVDYEPLRTNVTLNPSQVTANLLVNIIEDDITERTERFGVRIIIPEETQQLGVTLGSPSELEVRIGDDDRKLLFV